MSGIDIFDDQPGEDAPSPRAAEPVSAAESRATQLADLESQRSERQRVETIQRQLRLETSSRNRGYGLRALIGSLGSGRSSLLGSG
jgi:hypothetical protein